MFEKLKRKSIAPNIQESFGTLQPMPQQPTNNGNRIIGYQNTLLPQHHQQPPATPSMVFDNDDVLSRIDKTSTLARSVFIPSNPHGSNYNDHHARPHSPSRIPSPVKSTFSVRSNHQKIFKKPNNKIKHQQQQPQEISLHHQRRHHQHRSNDAPSEP